MNPILFLPAAAGLCLFFWEELCRLAALVRGNYRTAPLLLYRKAKGALSRRRSLKARIEIIRNGKKENFIAQSYATMTKILAATGEHGKEKQMRIISLVCAGCGALVSLYLKSYMLLPILTIGLGLVPMWLIKFKLFRYNICMQNELSVSLSMITNSYIRTENIVESVAENLIYMQEPCKSIFENFVYVTRSVDPNPTRNLQTLKQKIDNRIFHLWCDAMALCQSDINQKASLNAIVEQFATEKELLNLLSAEVSKPMVTFILIAALSSSCFPLAALMGRQLQSEGLLDVLFTTLIGQFLVVGYAVVLLFGVNRAINISTSME